MNELFTTFTDDISIPFTTIRCPKCGYRGQVTSEWAVISGQKMAGSCDWCDYESALVEKNKVECDFLVETWTALVRVADKDEEGRI